MIKPSRHGFWNKKYICANIHLVQAKRLWNLKTALWSYGWIYETAPGSDYRSSISPHQESFLQGFYTFLSLEFKVFGNKRKKSGLLFQWIVTIYIIEFVQRTKANTFPKAKLCRNFSKFVYIYQCNWVIFILCPSCADTSHFKSWERSRSYIVSFRHTKKQADGRAIVLERITKENTSEK